MKLSRVRKRRATPPGVMLFLLTSFTALFGTVCGLAAPPRNIRSVDNVEVSAASPTAGPGSEQSPDSGVAYLPASEVMRHPLARHHMTASEAARTYALARRMLRDSSLPLSSSLLEMGSSSSSHTEENSRGGEEVSRQPAPDGGEIVAVRNAPRVQRRTPKLGREQVFSHHDPLEVPPPRSSSSFVDLATHVADMGASPQDPLKADAPIFSLQEQSEQAVDDEFRMAQIEQSEAKSTSTRNIDAVRLIAVLFCVTFVVIITIYYVCNVHHQRRVDLERASSKEALPGGVSGGQGYAPIVHVLDVEAAAAHCGTMLSKQDGPKCLMGPCGLRVEEAANRLRLHGKNALTPLEKPNKWLVLLTITFAAGRKQVARALHDCVRGG